jgi:Plasma-membrane choline transporter
MGTYELSEKDKANPNNKKLEGSPNFKVGGNRGCTDVLFMLLLILAWAAMTGLGLVVLGVIKNPTFKAGNPARLLNGIDSHDPPRVCGVDAGVETRKKWYPLPSGVGVCVKGCPTTTDYARFYCDDTTMAKVYNSTADSFNVTAAWESVTAGNCMYQAESKDIFNYCVYEQAVAAFNATLAGAGNATLQFGNGTSSVNAASWFEDLAADLITSRALLLGFGLGGSCVLGFVYIFLLRIPGVLFLLVWSVMLAIWAAFGGAGVILKLNADKWAAEPEPRIHTTDQTKALLYLAYAMWALAGLWALLSLWLRKRIQIAIAITKEASRAVNSMKALILFPVLQCLGVAAFLVPWCAYAMYLASSGDITAVKLSNGATVKQFTYTNDIRYAALYLIFVYFWTSEFVVAVGQIVVAMSVATWYFTKDKKSIGSGTVVRSVGRTMWYHSGTAAFGSLIIAIIKTIRTVIAYLQKKAKNSGNKLLQASLCCLQCCMWCLEKCMKFLNKNAYIQTAIFGYSFCKAARKAFFLIARNILRVAAVGELMYCMSTIVICTLNCAVECVEGLQAYLVYGAVAVFDELSCFLNSMQTLTMRSQLLNAITVYCSKL